MGRRRSGGIAATVVVVLSMLALLAGCGSALPPAAPPPAAPPPAAPPPVAPPSAASPVGDPGTAPSRLLDPAAFATAVDAPGVTTVNVHVPYAGDVPGTDLSIPFDRIGAETSALPADRHAPLALYCRTGPMSAVAARTLAERGFTDIVELSGGMAAWTASGRPLIDAPGPR